MTLQIMYATYTTEWSCFCHKLSPMIGPGWFVFLKVQDEPQVNVKLFN